MAVTVTISTDKNTYQEGDPVVATVTVGGVDPGGVAQVELETLVRVNGTTYTGTGGFDVTSEGDEVTVLSVTADGVPFQQSTDDPYEWTGVA